MNTYELPDSSEKEQNQKRKILRSINLLVIFFIIGFLFWCGHLHYYAKSEYYSRQKNARMIYDSVCAWQTDGNMLTTCTGKLDGNPDSFQKYLPENFSGYYAIICNEQGGLDYILYSHRKISSLKQPVQTEEYRKIKLPVLSEYVVFACLPETSSPFV